MIKKWMLVGFSLLTIPLFQNCAGGVKETSVGGSAGGHCDLSAKASALTSRLQGITTDVDFALSVERSDGRLFTYERGAVGLNTSVESASTSKMVSTVIILRLVQAGYLTLTDHPQDIISGWPLSGGHPLASATLAQLLSFTSGYSEEALCSNSAGYSFDSCVINIANANSGQAITPGTQFYYSSSHLQIAGLMAVRARGLTWAQIFAEFQTQTGLFPTATYDLPSSTNPRLAGGMHWKGNEYHAFLKALRAGSLLNSTLMSLFLTDQTSAGVTIAYSPTAVISEQWHYGLGHWFECPQATWGCTTTGRISSPGAYGAYPFWDQEKGYFGILSRQGALGTFTNGLEVFRAAQNEVEEWVNCL